MGIVRAMMRVTRDENEVVRMTWKTGPWARLASCISGVLLLACGATPGRGTPAAGEVARAPRTVDSREHAVELPAGVFRMGSPDDEAERDTDEGPRLDVSVASFRMDRTPVTTEAFEARLAELQAVAPAARWWREDETPQGWRWKCNLGSTRRNHPANCVSWHAARAYCRLTGGDLPTEAEWEYAARAGTTGPFWWGTGFDDTRVISSVSCAARGCRGETAAVAQTGPRCNAWGLCDTAGNVWEWTLTGYQEHLSADVNVIPQGDPVDPIHRGGSWLNHVSSLFRAAHRGRNYPSHGLTGVGFRCVRR